MKKLLKKYLEGVKAELNIPADVTVDYPRETSFGHYSTNFPLAAANQLKQNPRDVAASVIKKLESKKDFTDSFSSTVAGPGFVNFVILGEQFPRLLKKILEAGSSFGKVETLKNKKIMVEYAQPNPFKSFHIGHLRNVVIGEALARILENAGAEVFRTNYQGDVGLHVAKCFYGMRQNPKNPEGIDERVVYLADCYVAGARAYKEDEKAKQEIQEINEKIYSMDETVKGEWEEKRCWSLDKFEQIFARLGSKFDRYYFESEMFTEGTKRCREALQKGILIEDDGCLVFPGEKYGLNRRVFVNKLALPTYEGKELGLAFCELSDFGNPDKVIHVVANEQINFFQVTFAVEKLLDPDFFGDKQFHLPYGLVTLQDGKMSSREGNIVLGEDIVNAAKDEVIGLIKKRTIGADLGGEKDQVAEAVAIAAVKYSFLKIGTMKDMVFNLKESVKMEGQSGPYILYSYVRSVNILKKAGVITEDGKAVAFDEKAGALLTEQDRNLIYEIIKLPELAEDIAEHYQLAVLAEYAYRLANAFAAFYGACPVVSEKNEKLRAMRIAMVEAFRLAMGKCLDLLGITRLDRM